MKTLCPIIGWAAIDDAKAAGATQEGAVAARGGGGAATRGSGVAVPGDAAARPLDARVVALVAGVAARGSLAAAALALHLPYRTAWALLREAETDLGRPLLALARGRGAKPTALGERLLAADRAARDLLAARARELAVPLRAAPGPRPGRALRVAASHDLAVAELRELWRARHRVAVEFHGSAEAIALYAQGRVDVAGFHVLAGLRGAHDPLLAALDPGRDVVLRFVVREQGLILPRGNPRGVRGFADVAAQRLSFVNRQPGSGTRLIVERLLQRARLAPADIRGFTREEFTHAAVAATVAAGNADCGFGLRAAAAQLALAFVPLVTERYGFACRRRDVDGADLRAFRALIAGAATRKVVAPLPGYRRDAPGTVAAVETFAAEDGDADRRRAAGR
jgi:molybdate transport repressor ModE-like protein